MGNPNEEKDEKDPVEVVLTDLVRRIRSRIESVHRERHTATAEFQARLDELGQVESELEAAALTYRRAKSRSE